LHFKVSFNDHSLWWDGSHIRFGADGKMGSAPAASVKAAEGAAKRLP